MSEFIEALQKSKGENELNILRNVIDKDILEKGKAGQLGEIRTWGGKKYQKTPKGWRPVKTGARDGGSQEESEGKKNQEVAEEKSNKWPEGSQNIKHALEVQGGSKYSDPSKISLDYDDKYGWAVSYDGREVGSLNKHAISKEQAKAAGWYKEESDKGKGGNESQVSGGKESSEKKSKKLTIKEQDSQNISKVQDVLKSAGIKSSDIRVHRGNEGRRTYDYTSGGVNPYRMSLDNNGKFTFSRGADSIKGDIDNESDVKKVEAYVKGNSILDKMREALGGNQGDMSSLIKELQGLF